MNTTAPLLASILLGVQALGLAMARAISCTALLPCFDKRYMGSLHRNAICLAISLPQAWVIWQSLLQQKPAALNLVVIGLKEAVLGFVLGLLLAIPYWTAQNIGTLVDNQRGGNAAQNSNPSLAADASTLGELTQRTLIALLIEAGFFMLMFDVLADSYRLWPALDAWPHWGRHNLGGITRIFQNFLSDSIVYAGPALLLLLAVEFGLAISSASVKGLDVYQVAMPVKSQLALWMLALYLGTVLKLMVDSIALHWGGGLITMLGRLSSG